MSKYKLRQILFSVLVGGLIGAGFCGLWAWRAGADPDTDAHMVCNMIASNPNNHGLDAVVLILISKNYGVKDIATEISYAIAYRCPQYISLAESWAHSPTVNGTTPEGGLA